DGQPVAATAAMGSVGYGYPDDQQTTAMRSDAGPGATSMLPPMNPDDGGYGYDDRPDRRQPKKSNVPSVLLVVAAVLALAGAIVIGNRFAGGHNPNDGKVPVPDFVGRPEASARRMADNVDLKVSTSRKPCDDQPRGNVCAQSPDSGEVDKGSTISLVISTGAPEAKATVPVPDLVGVSENAARRMAEDAGLNISVSGKECADQPEGNVCSQDPAAGTEVDKDTTVHLVVSAGAAEVDVPDVRGLQFDVARSRLTDKGFDVEKRTQASAQPPGVVISQDPQGGSPGKKGTTVTLTVAAPEDEVTIPADIVGQSCDAATAELAQLGLTATCTETFTPNRDDDGMVLSSNPAAGEQVARNTPVTLDVGRFQPDRSSEDPDVVDHRRKHDPRMQQ
ncbi:PASTA domain-containing protein, partial [Streptomyces sp. NPDC001288]